MSDPETFRTLTELPTHEATKRLGIDRRYCYHLRWTAKRKLGG